MRISGWSSDVCSSDLHRLAGVHGVVVRRVDAALVAVLDNHVVVDPAGPARMPVGEMVLEVKSVEAGVLWRDRRQLRLKPAVVVAEGPRSEGRRVGKAWVGTWGSGWWAVD